MFLNFYKKKNSFGRRTEVQIGTICTYIYSRNILEYPQIVGIDPRFIIFDIEGHSRIYDNISDLG